MKTITVYSKDYCPYCVRAISFLNKKNEDIAIDLKIIKVGPTDYDVIEDMLSKSNGKKTFPQIFIDNKSIGGYDEMIALERDNKLNILLN